MLCLIILRKFVETIFDVIWKSDFNQSLIARFESFENWSNESIFLNGS